MTGSRSSLGCSLRTDQLAPAMPHPRLKRSNMKSSPWINSPNPDTAWIGNTPRRWPPLTRTGACLLVAARPDRVQSSLQAPDARALDLRVLQVARHRHRVLHDL